MTEALAAYLDRIGVPDATTPDLPTLQALVAGHARAIAFENLDPFTGREVSVEPAAVAAKLVGHRRGGWCFEQNTVLRTALDELGYRTTGLAGRVRWGQPPDAPPLPRGHMLLRVDGLPDGPHVVDVGFGGLTLTGVLRLGTSAEQATPHEPFRVCPDGDGHLMQVLLGDAWRTQYRFDLTEQLPVDYGVSSWYLGHHPSSHFRTGLMVARPEPDRRYALAGARFSVHHLGGPSEHRDLTSVAELRGVLEEHFLLDLTGIDGLDDRLRTLLP